MLHSGRLLAYSKTLYCAEKACQGQTRKLLWSIRKLQRKKGFITLAFHACLIKSPIDKLACFYYRTLMFEVSNLQLTNIRLELEWINVTIFLSHSVCYLRVQALKRFLLAQCLTNLCDLLYFLIES